jgi:amidase
MTTLYQRGDDSMPTRSATARRVLSTLEVVFLTLGLIGSGSLHAQRQPSPSFQVFEVSVTELQDALSRGEVTSVELVDAYLARIAAYDDAGPALNAILQVNPNARAEAARLDAERAARGPRGPLHGIPIILKDNYDTADMPTTGATAALANHRPGEDAFQVQKLREAGAILLAKSNLHELAYGITTVSSLGGQTRNPYDLERNPGGSSGGTAAAVAASFAAIGWGSDTCGSIRVPAAANNLFGLRPTKGLSSISGIMPLSVSQDVGGPLARTMMDLAIGLDATVGFDPDDPATRLVQGRVARPFVETANDDLRGVRIGILRNYFGSSAEDEETNEIVRAALERFAIAGATVVEVEIPGFDELIAGTSLIDLEFKWNLYDYLARTPSSPVKSLTDIVNAGLHHAAVDGVLRRSDRHETREPAGYAEVVAKRRAAAEAVLSFLETNQLDALAYPPLRRIPALIGQPATGNNCQLSAAIGFPALVVPAGFTPSGVPVGLELLGPPLSDDRLVGFGFAYERSAQTRRPPPTTPELR